MDLTASKKIPIPIPYSGFSNLFLLNSLSSLCTEKTLLSLSYISLNPIRHKTNRTTPFSDKYPTISQVEIFIISSFA